MSATEGLRRGVLPRALMERWGCQVPFLHYCYGSAAEGLARDLGIDPMALGRRTDGHYTGNVTWRVPRVRTALESLVYEVAGLVLDGRREAYPLDEVVSLALDGVSPGEHLDLLLLLGGERVNAFAGTADELGETLCSVTRFAFVSRLGQAFQVYEREGILPGANARERRQARAAERRRERMKDR